MRAANCVTALLWLGPRSPLVRWQGADGRAARQAMAIARDPAIRRPRQCEHRAPSQDPPQHTPVPPGVSQQHRNRGRPGGSAARLYPLHRFVTLSLGQPECRKISKLPRHHGGVSRDMPRDETGAGAAEGAVAIEQEHRSHSLILRPPRAPALPEFGDPAHMTPSGRGGMAPEAGVL